LIFIDYYVGGVWSNVLRLNQHYLKLSFHLIVGVTFWSYSFTAIILLLKLLGIRPVSVIFIAPSGAQMICLANVGILLWVILYFSRFSKQYLYLCSVAYDAKIKADGRHKSWGKLKLVPFVGIAMITLALLLI